MSDRRHSTQYSAVHWNGVPHQYPTSNNYAPTYNGTSSHHSSSQQYINGYEQAEASPIEGYPSGAYYSTHTNFASPGSPSSHQVYPATHSSADASTQVTRQIHTTQRPQSTHPQPHPYQMAAYSHSHTSPHTHARARSHSQSLSPQSTYAATSSTAPYPNQIPLTQSPGGSSQYPASPSRPFSCDLCALSFNRQHDLKRHRETHTGEKPYLCNGGCGKTFTRKDALKRHQVGII
ncbi:hypothetical protein BDQ17DRAFT_1346327 [Cyathus striatus]|nr:hypothetical protein BDQ17DRAFT_1346327 [Cyathus striatus]